MTFYDEKDKSETTVLVPVGENLLEAAHSNNVDLEGNQGPLSTATVVIGHCWCFPCALQACSRAPAHTQLWLAGGSNHDHWGCCGLRGLRGFTGMFNMPCRR